MFIVPPQAKILGTPLELSGAHPTRLISGRDRFEEFNFDDCREKKQFKTNDTSTGWIHKSRSDSPPWVCSVFRFWDGRGALID